MPRKPKDSKTPKSPAPRPESPTHQAPAATREQRYRSVGEVYQQAVQLEGDKVSAEDILGERVVIHSYLKRRSRYPNQNPNQEYALVQIERAGNRKAYFSTASLSAIERLDRIANAMPVEGAFVHKTSASGRKYIAIE